MTRRRAKRTEPVQVKYRVSVGTQVVVGFRYLVDGTKTVITADERQLAPLCVVRLGDWPPHEWDSSESALFVASRIGGTVVEVAP